MKARASSFIGFVALSLLGCSTAAIPTSTPTSPQKPPTVMMAVTERRFVDTITVYDFDMLSGFSPFPYAVADSVKPQGVFIRVRATFVNVSDSELTIDYNEDFTLIDASGVPHRVATPATVTSRRVKYRVSPIADVRVPPGETYDALLFFDIPHSEGPLRHLKLRFRDDPPVSFAVRLDE